MRGKMKRDKKAKVVLFALLCVTDASAKHHIWFKVFFIQTHKHQDPLFRFFEREVKMGGKMLQEVRQDLSDVVSVCEGKKKQTNYLRTLISDLVKGRILLSHSNVKSLNEYR